MASSIKCPDCLEILAREHPGETTFSRFYVALDIHTRHEPMHPALVGGAHKRSARREHDAWSALCPLKSLEATNA